MEAATNRCPFKYMFFKIICEEVHLSVKLQALELKHLKINCFTSALHVFFEVFIIVLIRTTWFKKKNINSFRLVQILRFSFTFIKLKTSATSRKVTLIMILQQNI